MALVSESISQAQEMLTRVETEAAKAGLHCNAKKTEAMLFNQENDDTNIKSLTEEDTPLRLWKTLNTLVDRWKIVRGMSKLEKRLPGLPVTS